MPSSRLLGRLSRRRPQCLQWLAPRTPPPFYALGFDIATGIFGDPALGAQGNTASGPGSLGIRDTLSIVGQLGFNASMRLHLGPPPLARRAQ